MSAAAPERRDAYRHFEAIPTRWMDNDVYGHVNNVTYYSYFDTLISGYLIRAGGLDIQRDTIIGVTELPMPRSRPTITSIMPHRKYVGTMMLLRSPAAAMTAASLV